MYVVHMISNFGGIFQPFISSRIDKDRDNYRFIERLVKSDVGDLPERL